MGLMLATFVVVWVLMFIHGRMQRRAPVEAYVATGSAERPVAKKKIDLDRYQQDAVDGLMYYGMTKKAAIAALEYTGWRGHPDVIEMVQAVWQSQAPKAV